MAVAATGIPEESGEPAMDKPRMKGRHLVMMSLGSAIGTGLFVGSGKGVAAAGPATLVAYIVAGLLVIAIMYMLGEMVAAHPDSGAFSVYTSRAMGSAAGFAMGWVWWIELVVVVAAEAIAAASTLVAMWPIAPVWLLTLIFLVVLTAINLLGADRFGEFEFWFALLKVVAVVVFLAIGVLLICGVLAAPAEHPTSSATADSCPMGGLGWRQPCFWLLSASVASRSWRWRPPRPKTLPTMSPGLCAPSFGESWCSTWAQ